MSTRQYLTDASTKHQVFLLRYAGSTYKQMLPFLERIKNETNALLLQNNTPLNRARYQALIKSVRDIVRAITKDMNSTVKNQMYELANYEADFTKRLTEKGTNILFETVTPSVTQLKAAAFTSVMDSAPGVAGSITVQQALSEYGAKKASDVVQAIRTGYATGQTTDDIVKVIKGTIDGVASRQAYALARTITTHVASEARATFYAENADLVTGYQVVATLDDRTTDECMALDGQVFTPEDFAAPPYHWNCRTTYIAVLSNEYNTSDVGGTRPAKGDDGKVEHVSTQTTYNSWLKTQPNSFQNEVLGKTKAELFRAGASVHKFVDENFQPLTIKQLRAKDDLHVFFDKIAPKE